MENSSTRKVIFYELDNYNLASSLKSYCQLLKSHNSGKCKLIVNSCDNKLVAYHYSATLDHLQFNHPIFHFINTLIKGMPYSGDYSGIIISSYLSELLHLRHQLQITDRTHLELLTGLSQVKEEVINSLHSAKREEAIDCDRLLSVVSRALKPMPLEETFRRNLTIQVVRAVLSAVDESSSKLGHIQLYNTEGRDYCQHFNGVLYKCDSLWSLKDVRPTSGEHVVAIFSEPLVIDRDCVGPNVTLVHFIKCLLSAGIGIVCCQKSIDKRIIFHLRRNNVISLERFGEEKSNVLVALSGATPIADCSVATVESLARFTGVLSGCRSITINEESYVLLEKNSSKSVTLFISMRCTDIYDQLKVVVKECILTVYSIIRNPFFLPENFDSSLAEHLRNFTTEDILLKRLMSLFAETLESSMPATADQINYIFMIKRNCLEQVFSAIMNMLQVGLFIDK